MRYFIDTEFRERPCTIELISIGIVAEDGREYYAISKDFNLRDAWKDEWIRENVLRSIYNESSMNSISYPMTRSLFSSLLNKAGKSNKEIALEIINFINFRPNTYMHGIGLDQVIYSITKADCWNECYYPKEFEYIKKHNTFIPEKIFSTGFDGKGAEKNREIIYNQPEFYAYYADYDWVVFCWLFGRMIDLPKGFPKYCRDLKQMLDENILTKSWTKENCPDPDNEHNALSDAKWNKLLYEKIQYFKTH